MKRYSEKELQILERHIREHFGAFDRVLHEFSSEDLHVDIYVINPTVERNFYTLVTLGMGAGRMNVPEEYAEYDLERAELVISLPADWDLESEEERWSWPADWLKFLARLPFQEESWLGWGHTVDNVPEGSPLAENTELSSVLLLSPGGFEPEAAVCILPDESEVNFYSIIPLYEEERDYKLRHGTDALLELFSQAEEELELIPLDVNRKNVCAGEGKTYGSDDGVGREALLRASDIAKLESYEMDGEAYFGRMFEYLENVISDGVESGRFTEEEAREDLEIALWYSYICNNLDDYEHYYLAAQWMPASEKNAAGCGTWYYRYSCALMYCGRLDEALWYAKMGVQEEPEYAWGYLQLGKLLCHFGDKDGALQAVEKGLLLEPDDYEFLTLRREIGEGRSLPEMEYHYIDPEHDRKLQEGLLGEEGVDKQRAVSGIVCDRQGLERIKALFAPTDWEADLPYCTFTMEVHGRKVEFGFCMNEAALSGMDYDFVSSCRDKLTDGRWPACRTEDGRTLFMTHVIFRFDGRVDLIYGQEGEPDYLRVRMEQGDETREELSWENLTSRRK
ncbi:MAG: suppressor of fused domain protein [Eubacteriales bacterium]|nr:suppressor of fused domain protein [Eubacteriales bacterium]